MTNLNDLENLLIEIRRDLHKYPELGWSEFRTSSVIVSELSKIGWEINFLSNLIDINNIIGNDVKSEEEIHRAISEGADPLIISSLKIPGVIATLDTGTPGKNYGFRFDIDAVATTESKETIHRPNQENFSSVHLGISHSCGHDGHTALGISLAHYIAENKNNLKGKFIFLFQPAEEGCRGAYSIKDLKVISSIDEFFAFHLGICAKSGNVVLHPTNFLVSTKFKVKIFGKSAHAGIEPEKGINALHCATKIATQIFSLKELRESAKVNLGNFTSTNAQNVICDLVTFNGECRDISQDLNDELYRMIQHIIAEECKKFEAKYSIEMIGNAVSINNSTELDKIILKAADDSNLNVTEHAEFKACEDCGHIISKIQNCGHYAGYYILGNSISGPHHSEFFDLDEKGLIQSLHFLCSLVNSLE